MRAALSIPALAILVAAGALPAQAAPFTLLYAFQPTTSDGQRPESGLVDLNGTLYGETEFGGVSNLGTVFAITPDGTESVVHSFQGGSDGSIPFDSGLVNVDGTLYGTTSRGGPSDAGTVFSLAPDGTETVVYSFAAGSDGSFPIGPLLYWGGMLYGVTQDGGGACNCGTVFSLTPGGTKTTLYSFAGGSDGENPNGGLIEFHNRLFGITWAGGNSTSGGTAYSITAGGVERILHEFGGSGDGLHPVGELVEVQGTLYGTTNQGYAAYGTVYSYTPATSTYQVLHSFSGGLSDGASPLSGLINVRGTLYGETASGGSRRCSAQKILDCGTVYSITPSGTETLIHQFTEADGSFPAFGLTYLKPLLYGTTEYGGTTTQSGVCENGCGTVFSLKIPK